MEERGRRRWSRAWPFALLCLGASCEWLLTDALPQAASTAASQYWACLGLAAVCAGCGLVRRAPRHRAVETGWAALAGGLVLGGPAAGLLLHVPVDVAGLAIALSLTPVVLLVAAGVVGSSPGGLVEGELWPALAGPVGLLLFLSAPSLGNPASDVVLLLAPVLTGVGCVLFARRPATVWGLAAAFGGAAVVFGASALVGQHGLRGLAAAEPLAVGIDAVLGLLALVALSRLQPAQYAARYVAVPLLVLLQGFVFLRSIPTWRSVACGALLAYGGWVLMRGDDLRSAEKPPSIVPG